MSIMAKFPSKYLKAADITPDEVVTIDEVRDEKVGIEQEEKPVLYLKEYDRGIVLNKTNAQAIVDVYGDDEKRLPGKKLTLFTERVRFNGKVTDAIRMEAVQPQPKAAEMVTTIDGPPPHISVPDSFDEIPD